MHVQRDDIESPIGTITIVARDGALCALDYADCEQRMTTLLGARFSSITWERVADPHGLSTRVRAYLGGDLAAFDDVALDLGGTPFQQEVWAALRRIPAGETRSYGELAAALGRPTGARAVGLANGRNPVSIAVPCHRVIGAGGALTGYAGGLPRKQWLLAHERTHAVASAISGGPGDRARGASAPRTSGTTAAACTRP